MNKNVILCSIAAAAFVITGFGVYKAHLRNIANEPTPSCNPNLCKAILSHDLLEEGPTPLGQGLKKLGDDSLKAAHFDNLWASIEENDRKLQAECPQMYRDLIDTSKSAMAKAPLTIFGGTRQPSDAEIESVCSDPDRAAMVQARWLELQN